MKVAALLNVMSCILLDKSRRFDVTFCLHFWSEGVGSGLPETLVLVIVLQDVISQSTLIFQMA